MFTPTNLPTVPEPAVPAALPAAPSVAPASVKHVIPEGTVLSVRLIDSLDSSRNRVGDSFRGTLNTPIREGAEIVVPAGADVEGRVVDVSSAGHYSGHSELKLELTKLKCNRQLYALQTESYARANSGRGKGTAQALGGGAALGAIIGGIAGRGKGAAIGSPTRHRGFGRNPVPLPYLEFLCVNLRVWLADGKAKTLSLKLKMRMQDGRKPSRKSTPRN